MGPRIGWLHNPRCPEGPECQCGPLMVEVWSHEAPTIQQRATGDVTQCARHGLVSFPCMYCASAEREGQGR